MKEEFREIFMQNRWGGLESLSGKGSGLAATERIRAFIDKVLFEYDVTFIIDAGCGDFWWMKELDLAGRMYLGLDVVPEIIIHNQREYSRIAVAFQLKDISTDPLPKADLILCRDVLVHLPLEAAAAALENFRASGSSYLLTTTFPATKVNGEILAGQWRPLNLCKAPFNLPKPIKCLEESPDHPCDITRGKRLALWRLA